MEIFTKITDLDGRTGFMWAFYLGHKDVVKSIVKYPVLYKSFWTEFLVSAFFFPFSMIVIFLIVIGVMGGFLCLKRACNCPT